jgi:D-aminopeptidase
LRRVAGRATFGLGRAGGFGANASGEYALAFSTAQRIRHREDAEHLELRFLRDDSAALRELFEAAAELVHEAVLNALCVAHAMEGRDGNQVEALPYELLEQAPGLHRGR